MRSAPAARARWSRLHSARPIVEGGRASRPFAARRYLVRGEDGTLVWVTVGESTGGQTASWSANVLDAALARTGQDVEVYRYDYPTFFAAGLTAPAGEGGGSRPFADLGFCYQPRAEVDLWVARQRRHRWRWAGRRCWPPSWPTAGTATPESWR